MSEEQWIWQCDRVIPNDPGAGRKILDELLDQMQVHDWVERDIYSVRLAVEEAMVNAIMHGNRMNNSKHVRIHCRLAPKLVSIEVGDEGGGFDPGRLPDPTIPERLKCPSGRGVMLIKAFMSRVQYNAEGNRVLMEKERTEPQ